MERDSYGLGSKLAALLIILPAFSGCALLPATTAVALPVPGQRAEGPGERISRNQEGQITARTEYWIDEQGNEIRHGVEAAYWADGRVKFHREFDHGTPSGHWQTFWKDGTPRSDHDILSGQATAMVYYHPNGSVAAKGQAVAGQRVGAWTYWFDSGVVAEEGAYGEGKREGSWRFYGEDGSMKEEAVYSDGKRVGHTEVQP